MKVKNNIPTIEEPNEAACCSLDEKMAIKPTSKKESNTHDHSHDHDHDHGDASEWKTYIPSIISFVLLVSGLILEYLLKPDFFKGWLRIGWYTLAFLPVGIPVLKAAWKALLRKEIFTEFFLMSIATIGAFAIGEYPEGVAVMLFYTIGELFQGAAVSKAKNNIKALLDVRPKSATVLRNGIYEFHSPETVNIGEIMQVKVGENIPLDGILLSAKASLNAAALTGESKPQYLHKGAIVSAGSINLEGVVDIKVTKLYNDSSIARIIDLVQNATARKSKTELLIRRLAKIYTPIVVYLAIAIIVLPYFFVSDYLFSDWLYRALIFLVISCPCALVISIPLGYFGGLGAASKNGLLFKGATYLDQLAKVNTLVMDKTGTLTKGVFKIKDIVISNGLSKSDFMQYLLAIEAKSTHPIAKAILEYAKNIRYLEANEIEELAGKGLKGKVAGKDILVGNKKLLHQFDIKTPTAVDKIVESVVLVAIDSTFAGYVTIADELKEDAKESIIKLKSVGIKNLLMLSGDKDSIVQKIAKELGINQAKGGLLPEDKLAEVNQLKEDATNIVAFVGDGINDAPVLAASDIGIAMGGMGSDVAIETADIVIQTDQPSKIVTGILIAKSTQQIIWQNITLAFGVKAIVMILGAIGLATMWAAVFADVGVALLAILNAVRLQRMKWG